MTTSNLLDHIIATAPLKNDAALARALNVAPPVISKLRNGKLPLGAGNIIRIHEEFNISIKEIKSLAGIN